MNLLLNTIMFQQLELLTFDDWKALGNDLDETNGEIIDEYYSLEYGKDNPPYYHCLPLFNSVSNDSAYKFLIIQKDDDEVFVAYKVVQILTTKLIKVMDKPISKLGITQNEKDIISVLETIKFFKFCYKEKYADWYSMKGEISNQDCDYYYEYEKEIERYSTKFKHKNHFNRFENNDFKIEFVNEMNIKQLSELRGKWEKAKIDIGTEITTKLNKFDKIMSKLNGNQHNLFMNIYYKNELVLNYCLLICNGYAVNIYRTSLSRTENNCDDTWIKNTFSRLDKYAIYRLIQYLNKIGINYVYFAGASPKNKSLIEHKEKHSSGKIVYLTHNARKETNGLRINTIR